MLNQIKQETIPNEFMYNTLEFMLYLDFIFTICFTPKTIQMDYDLPSLQHIIDT